jgi:hypothetical protein
LNSCFDRLSRGKISNTEGQGPNKDGLDMVAKKKIPDPFENSNMISQAAGFQFLLIHRTVE